MTRRSGVYLEVLQRNAGLRDPHSLHISILILQGINACKAIGVKTAPTAVKNNFFSPETHSELGEDRSILFYNSKIACVAWRYKAAKENKRPVKPLPLALTDKLATDHRKTTRDCFLFGSMNVTKHSCDVICTAPEMIPTPK